MKTASSTVREEMGLIHDACRRCGNGSGGNSSCLPCTHHASFLSALVPKQLLSNHRYGKTNDLYQNSMVYTIGIQRLFVY